MLALLFATASAQAEPPVREPGKIHAANSFIFGARVNPLGLRIYQRSGVQMTLYDSKSAALHQNFIFLGGRANLSPAFARLGAVAILQPLTILTLTGIYEGGYFFGNFDDMQSYSSNAADYSDSARNAASNSADADAHNYDAWGHHVRLKARLRAKFWQIAVQNEGGFHLRDYPLRAGDSYTYDSDYDALVKDGGWLYTNEADVVWQPNERITVGVRHFWSRPLYADEPGVNNAQQRMGPIFMYNFKLARQYNELKVIGMVNWYLHHRFRTGQDVSGAIPWAILALNWEY